MEKKEEFKAEKELMYILKNLKSEKRKKEDKDLYGKVMKQIDAINASSEKKEVLKNIINKIDPEIKDLNNIFFVTAINITFTKMLLISKSVNISLPTELVVPLLNLREDLGVWLDDMNDAVLPFILNSTVLNNLGLVKGEENDNDKENK